MAKVPIELGKDSSKLLGTSLLIADATVEATDAIVVVVAYLTSDGPPDSVKYGNVDIGGAKVVKENAGAFGLSLYINRSVNNASIRDITATWLTDVSYRAMIATRLIGPHYIDTSGSRTTDLTSTPATGDTAAPITTDREIALGFFVSNGDRTLDSKGDPTDGFSHGDRTGNEFIDLIGTYFDLTGSVLPFSPRAKLTNTAIRDWAQLIVTFYEPRPANAHIIFHVSNYEALIESVDASKQNAMLVYLNAYYNDNLPVTPPAYWLDAINLTQLDYTNAVTLLRNLGIVETRTDDYFLVRTAT